MDAFLVYIPCGFVISAHGESRFPNGLEFPCMARVISQMVWCSRAWRKSFPEWFVISALGESRFLKGLAFSCMAKVISWMVLRLRASRNSLFKGFDACGLPANHFLKDFALAGLPQIIPYMLWSFRAWRKSFPEWFGVSVYAELICSTFRLIIYSCVCIAWRVIVCFLLILLLYLLKKYA